MGVEASKADVVTENPDSGLATTDEIRAKVRLNQSYAVKVCIRGERASGKTLLWKRLQGLNYSSIVSFSFFIINECNILIPFYIFPAFSTQQHQKCRFVSILI